MLNRQKHVLSQSTTPFACTLTIGGGKVAHKWGREKCRRIPKREGNWQGRVPKCSLPRKTLQNKGFGAPKFWGISPKFFAELHGIHPYLCTCVLACGQSYISVPKLEFLKCAFGTLSSHPSPSFFPPLCPSGPCPLSYTIFPFFTSPFIPNSHLGTPLISVLFDVLLMNGKLSIGLKSSCSDGYARQHGNWNEPETSWESRGGGGLQEGGFQIVERGCVFFAWKSVIAREVLLKIDTLLAIATSGLRTNLLFEKPPSENPPFDFPEPEPSEKFALWAEKGTRTAWTASGDQNRNRNWSVKLQTYKNPFPIRQNWKQEPLKPFHRKLRRKIAVP